MRALLATFFVFASANFAKAELITHTNYSTFFQLLTLDEQFAGAGEVESGVVVYTPFQTHRIDVGSERLLDFTYLVDDPHPVLVLYDDGSIDIVEFSLNPSGWHYAVHWIGLEVSNDDPRNITTIYLLPQSPTLLWGVCSYEGR